MYKRVTHILSTYKIIFLLLVLTSAVVLASVAQAADQGKLGKQSRASVEISVIVNQTLSSVSPNELLLNKNLTSTYSEPFCVAHHGLNQNAKVPYELIVDHFKAINNRGNKQVMPFNVYLEDKNILNSKQQLIQGVSISTQSNFRINKNMQSACANSGLQLTIEENDLGQNTPNTSSPGIMILLISPS